MFFLIINCLSAALTAHPICPSETDANWNLQGHIRISILCLISAGNRRKFVLVFFSLSLAHLAASTLDGSCSATYTKLNHRVRNETDVSEKDNQAFGTAVEHPVSGSHCRRIHQNRTGFPAEKEAFAVNYIELKNVRLLDTPDKMLSREEQMQNTGIAALALGRSGGLANHRRNIGMIFWLLWVVLPQLFMGRIQRNRKKHGDNVLRSLMLARFERKADGKKEALAPAY